MIFHTPAKMKKAASKTAETTLSNVFHAGSSSGAAASDGCAILSSMFPILALIALLSAASGVAQIADLVVENARVYTVNPAQPSARALAVKDGRILAVADDVSKYIGPQTRKIDAKGDAIVPGLTD